MEHKILLDYFLSNQVLVLTTLTLYTPLSPQTTIDQPPCPNYSTIYNILVTPKSERCAIAFVTTVYFTISVLDDHQQFDTATIPTILHG